MLFYSYLGTLSLPFISFPPSPSLSLLPSLSLFLSLYPSHTVIDIGHATDLDLVDGVYVCDEVDALAEVLFHAVRRVRAEQTLSVGVERVRRQLLDETQRANCTSRVHAHKLRQARSRSKSQKQGQGQGKIILEKRSRSKS